MISKIVEGHSIPIRLDRYLRIINPSLTQGIIERALRKGAIKVNEAKVKANARVVNGDIISFPEAVIARSLEGDAAIHNTNKYSRCAPRNDGAASLANKLLSEYLLYDHPAFYAFYKPAGLASQGGSKISTSLDDALKSLGLRLVNRLDKDTSGIMIAAKTRDDAIRLTKAFADQKIYKTYLACVKNLPKKPKGKITSYLLKENNYTVNSYDKEIEGSKIAITEYEVISSNELATLIKFTPQTGRMHQLRVHAKDLGSPIIGDRKYGGELNKYLMLHAYELTLDKSIFVEEIVITAPLPEYFMVM